MSNESHHHHQEESYIKNCFFSVRPGDVDIALIRDDSSVGYVKLDGYAIVPKEIFKSDERIKEIKESIF